jgi:ABC-2 type transport system ATP-binding protein
LARVWNSAESSGRSPGKPAASSSAEKLRAHEPAVCLEDASFAALYTFSRNRRSCGAYEPSIVFLDEPTGGVDPLSRRRFWKLIDELSRSGVSVLVTTHYLDEAEHCHRIAIIQAGKLAALGTVAELKATFAGRPIVEIRTPRPVEAMRLLDALPQVEKTSIFGTSVHAVLRTADAGAQTIDAALAGRLDGPIETSLVEPSLEDVFLDLALRDASPS